MTRKVRDSVGFNQIIPFFILYRESCIMYLVSRCQASLTTTKTLAGSSATLPPTRHTSWRMADGETL